MSLGDKLKNRRLYRSITSVDFNVTFAFSSFAFYTHFLTSFALSPFRILCMFTFALSRFRTFAFYNFPLMVPKCLDTVSGQFVTSAEVSHEHFGTCTELSPPPANIFHIFFNNITSHHMEKTDAGPRASISEKSHWNSWLYNTRNSCIIILYGSRCHGDLPSNHTTHLD